MRYLLLFLFLLPTKNTTAQGFKRIYDLGMYTASFLSLDIRSDTINLIGFCRDTLPPYTLGICFTQMDTFGTVLNQKCYFTDKDYWVGTYNQPFIRLKDDQGYAIAGTFYGTNTGYLLCLNLEGNFLFVKEHTLSNSLTFYWNEMYETDHGFVVAGNSERLGQSPDPFVLRLDKSGNWVDLVTFDGGRYEAMTGFTKINENEFVLSTGSGTIPTSSPTSKTCSQFFGMDSLLNQTWFWESPLANDEVGGSSIQKTNNGDWLYTTQKVKYNPTIDDFQAQIRIVRRDPSFNLLWSKPYTGHYDNFNRLYDVQPYPGGGYVGVGYIVPDGYQVGFSIRINESGDLLWERKDTAFYDTQLGADNIIGAVGFLPSGSIVACGTTVDWTIPQTLAWLLKFTPDGCIDTLNCKPISALHEPPNRTPVLVNLAPNPANDQITFSRKQLFEGHLEIWNTQGQLVHSVQWTGSQAVVQISTQTFPSGLYYYTLTGANTLGSVGKFVVQH